MAASWQRSVSGADRNGSTGRLHFARSPASVLEHEPPKDREAEMALLGAIILGSQRLPDVLPILTPDDFFYPQHQHVYRAMLALHAEGAGIDEVTVLGRLRSDGVLDEIGKAAFIGDLIRACPNSVNIASYAKAVKATASKRQLIQAASETLVNAYQPDAPIADLAERLEHVARDASEGGSAPRAVVRCFSDITPRPIRWLWRHRIPRGAITILDGNPGLGKSTIIIDLAARVSRGWHMPPAGGPCGQEPANILLLTAEDDPETTIRPRLDAAGADVDRVFVLSVIKVGRDEQPLILPSTWSCWSSACWSCGHRWSSSIH